MKQPMKQMRVPERVHALLQVEAERTGRTITGMLKVMVEEYLARVGKIPGEGTTCKGWVEPMICREKEGKDE